MNRAYKSHIKSTSTHHDFLLTSDSLSPQASVSLSLSPLPGESLTKKKDTIREQIHTHTHTHTLFPSFVSTYCSFGCIQGYMGWRFIVYIPTLVFFFFLVQVPMLLLCVNWVGLWFYVQKSRKKKIITIRQKHREKYTVPTGFIFIWEIETKKSLLKLHFEILSYYREIGFGFY